MGDFNTPFSPINRPSREKLKRKPLELTNIIYQKYQEDIYRKFHPKIKNAVFPGANGMIPKSKIY